MAGEDVQQAKTIRTSHSSSSTESVPKEIIVEILSRLPIESLLRCKSVCKLWRSLSDPHVIKYHLIVEILSRLPVKSLLRCKSVCKSWRSLISDPYFIKYHLTLSTTDNNHYKRQHLLVSSDWPGGNLETCPLNDVMYDHNTINPLELDYPLKHPGNDATIVGSCNGLICIRILNRHLFIWNPSTRKSIQLPDPDRRRSGGTVSHGFGYNESSDDYKVVEITRTSLLDKNDTVVMIYSSRNDNWKKIGLYPHQIWSRSLNVFLKGALHWIASIDRGPCIIVSLDLEHETYGEILLPMDEKVDIPLRLGKLGDCLCVLHDCGRNSCADVWVMKDYGVKDSWFKLVSMSFDLVFGQFDWGDHFSAPLCVSDGEKVLLRVDSTLIMVDLKNNSTVEIQKFNECGGACTYVESLVSPAGHENLI